MAVSDIAEAKLLRHGYKERPISVHESDGSSQSPDFVKRKENVNKSQAGNAATNVIISGECIYPWKVGHKKVLVP
jgi:hypothetical protein